MHNKVIIKVQRFRLSRKNTKKKLILSSFMYMHVSINRNDVCYITIYYHLISTHSFEVKSKYLYNFKLLYTNDLYKGFRKVKTQE